MLYAFVAPATAIDRLLHRVAKLFLRFGEAAEKFSVGSAKHCYLRGCKSYYCVVISVSYLNNSQHAWLRMAV